MSSRKFSNVFIYLKTFLKGYSSGQNHFSEINAKLSENLKTNLLKPQEKFFSDDYVTGGTFLRHW